MVGLYGWLAGNPRHDGLSTTGKTGKFVGLYFADGYAKVAFIDSFIYFNGGAPLGCTQGY